ncbi:LLM class F420-dependent oxidoreductase [Streptomyces resistomycificus]|uniref:Oxidoreductase n=1 Tax=Streptomyces resistomycificus TaxID=67356 RepID=A0A0L8LZ66_9ACTN|nr:LLM class F420-dependent oxidoreductase [Streptomyces resistomycificus]KOG43473.1 oxidoreductase [Streptomyces resistomycificus]KUN91465.1 LLM class F420-dependent oxidoreductase [Streptomyces resistomycificus]
MDISVVAVGREDDSPVDEPVRVAVLADRLGYREVWVGEGPTWDSFVLATAIGLATERVELTAGPVPVSVRDPFTIARGAAGVAAVTGRPAGVALGTSSKRVVEGVHGRPRLRPATALEESAAAVRGFLHGVPGEPVVPGSPFRRRLPPPGGRLTVAAFGDRAIATAAAHADRMLLDVVSPEQVRVLRASLLAAAEKAGRTPPTLAAWLPAAVDPKPESRAQVLGSIAGYLTVPGYRDMFTASGLGEAVELAAAGADRDTLLRALPPEAAGVVGLVGDLDTVRSRIDAYAEAGLDEIALVPATAGDPAGERTLRALRPA